MIHDAHVFIFEKNKRITTIVGAIGIFLLTIGVFSYEASSKTDVNGLKEIRMIINGISGPGGYIDLPGLEGFREMTETSSGGGGLNVGQSESVPVPASEDRVIRSINVTLTWSDEPDRRFGVRMYENAPDTFEVKVLDPTGNDIRSGSTSNPQGGQGSIDVPVLLTDDEVVDYKGKGDFTVEITLTDSGVYSPRIGLGVRTVADGANDYSLSIEVVSYDNVEEE